ncbi:MAG TPA: ATP-binding protein, partial [Burkholderiaceae bacterium]|nr:ATP-binding protein [Burkholderiaceae bacterium]
MQRLDLGKYRVLAVAIGLFLIFDLGVLVLNFVISSQIAADAVSVNLAGRQRMLSQRTAKSLLLIDRRLQLGEPLAEELTELRSAFKLFDDTLKAFGDGGAAVGGAGEAVQLNRVDGGEGRMILSRTLEIWTPYREKLVAVVGADAPAPAAVRAAVEISRSANLPLLGLMNDLTTHVEKVAASKATFLRQVQVGGISLATLNFLLILFHFLRHLRQSDRRLEAAKRETDEILRTVSDGLFLLDRKFRIGSQRSAALDSIFEHADLAGSDFLALLRRLVDDKTLATAKDYIALLFGDRVNEKLVRDLNPLDAVEVSFGDGRGGFAAKFLEFRFTRVFEGGRLAHLLVTVNDITAKVRLERELQAARDRTQTQMDLLLEVLHLEPAALRSALAAARETLSAINAVLRAPAQPATGYQAKVDVIFRLAHRMKGDAAAHGLGTLEHAAHEIEDVLANLRVQAKLSGNDFLPVTVRVEQMFARIDSLEDLIARLGELRPVVAAERDRHAHGAGNAKPESPWRPIESLAARICARLGKRATFHYQGAEHERIPAAYRKPLFDILAQFVRNACVHGIEPAAERIMRGKAECGDLTATVLRTAEGGLEVTFRDDGAGFDLERLRQAAVSGGWGSSNVVAAWDARQLVKLIFEPSFSTAAAVDEDGGRGVGLDVVKNLVDRLGGGLRIASTTGQYC